jgi:protein required for attachment to host cells
MAGKEDHMTAQDKLWVVAFDGALARVWSCDAAGRLHERTGEGLDARNNSEAARSGGRGEGQPDLPHSGFREQMTEPAFVEHFTKRLATRGAEGGFDRLIVSAGPRALGWFRRCAPADLQQRIVAEIDRDHVHTPVKALEASLAEHLAHH